MAASAFCLLFTQNTSNVEWWFGDRCVADRGLRADWDISISLFLTTSETEQIITNRQSYETAGLESAPI